MPETVETRLGILENSIGKMEKAQTKNFEKMFNILEGEGNSPGIKTCVQLQNASLKRLYKWVAGITVVMLGAVEEVIRRNI